MNGASTYCSRKAAKLAKKKNEMNLLKNLRVFAPLRETFSVPVYPGYGLRKQFRTTDSLYGPGAMGAFYGRQILRLYSWLEVRVNGVI